jgi:uncharacterized membrane-anchored protein
VPEVTVYFWLITVLCTLVGETAADVLHTRFISALLIVALVFQWRSDRYKPGIYWPAVVLAGVVGTVIADGLSDSRGAALFGAALAATFGVWFASERTLSIHTIFTARREAMYWLAVLSTFALGTAGGDLVSAHAGPELWKGPLIFSAALSFVAFAHFRLRLNAVLSFWLAYIVTRPLGASMGDYLSHARGDGGLGLGTTETSAIVLTTILGLVVYVAATRTDRTAAQAA